MVHKLRGTSLEFDSSWRRPSGDIYEYKTRLRSLPSEVNILGEHLEPSEWAIKSAMDAGKSNNTEQLMSLFQYLGY